MSRRGLLPYPVIEPSTGKSLVNGNFEHTPMGLGFDWRLTNLPGLSVHYEETTPHLRIAFSGKQPESCEPLAEWVVLQPLRKYRLTCRYESSGIPPGSGLKWQLYNSANGAQIIPDALSLSHEGQTNAQMEFRPPEACQLGRLALVYHVLPEPSGSRVLSRWRMFLWNSPRAAVIVPDADVLRPVRFVSALWPIAAAQTEAANQSVKSGTLESARRSRNHGARDE